MHHAKSVLVAAVIAFVVLAIVARVPALRTAAGL